MTKGAEMQTKARDGGSLEKKRRRETKPNGCTHQQEEEKKNRTKQGAGSRTTEWLTADWPTDRKWKKRWTISPTGGDREVHHSPGFKGHAPALQAGDWGPGPKRGLEQKRKERRGDKEKEERDSAAPNVIMQWTGSANGGRAGCFCFLFFSRWGDAAACVARAQLRGGAPVQGNLWKAHTHRSGQGGCMLENSGLVLGVDSSLGLLTRLHNPRHVGVALLVHGRLLHLTQKETEKRARLFSLTWLCTTYYCSLGCMFSNQTISSSISCFCWKSTFCTL